MLSDLSIYIGKIARNVGFCTLKYRKNVELYAVCHYLRGTHFLSAVKISVNIEERRQLQCQKKAKISTKERMADGKADIFASMTQKTKQSILMYMEKLTMRSSRNSLISGAPQEKQPVLHANRSPMANC